MYAIILYIIQYREFICSFLYNTIFYFSYYLLTESQVYDDTTLDKMLEQFKKGRSHIVVVMKIVEVCMKVESYLLY